MDKNDQRLELYKQIRAIAQTGLAYSANEFDLERYSALKNISFRLISDYTKVPVKKIEKCFLGERGYQTPKVDIRAVVFSNEKMLFVREKTDQKWSLPGGYADIGFSPSEMAVKEVSEEAGLDVKPVRLLAVFDKRYHNHPPDIQGTYSIFFQCEIRGGTLSAGMETSEAAFFSRDKIPENLSTPRITRIQVINMFTFLENPDALVIFD